MRRPKFKFTYSHFDELFASPVEPLAKEKITYHMTKVYEGLDALDTMLHPEVHHWQAVADAANMLDTLSKDMAILDDNTGIIRSAMEILALAWNRREQGIPNELDHDDITTLRLMVNSYMDAMETLPARVMIKAHRETEKRMYQILNGNKRQGDIVI